MWRASLFEGSHAEYSDGCRCVRAGKRASPRAQPRRKGSAKVEGAGTESDRKGSEADERRSDQFAAWVRLANGLYVIEGSQRNPIVQGQEQHVETLKREQCAHDGGMHDHLESTALSQFSPSASLLLRAGS